MEEVTSGNDTISIPEDVLKKVFEKKQRLAPPPSESLMEGEVVLEEEDDDTLDPNIERIFSDISEEELKSAIKRELIAHRHQAMLKAKDAFSKAVSNMQIGMVKMNGSGQEIPFRYLSFYAYLALKCDVSYRWDIDTACAWVSKRSKPCIAFNPDFVLKITRNLETASTMVLLTVHELFHNLFGHSFRGERYHKEIANMAMDMAINHFIVKEAMTVGNRIVRDFCDFPKDNDGNNSGMLLPVEYKGLITFECIYEWLYDCATQNTKTIENGGTLPEKAPYVKMACGVEGYDIAKVIRFDPNGSGSGNEGSGKSGSGGSGGNSGNSGGRGSVAGDIGAEQLDQHDLPADIQDDKASDKSHEIIMEGLMNEAKARGFESSNIVQAMREMKRKKRNLFDEIMKNIHSFLPGTDLKNKSYQKYSRKTAMYGGSLIFKGTITSKMPINVVADVSGSMCNEILKLFAFLLERDFQLNIIQIDTEIKAVDVLKSSNDLPRLKLKGFGGTTLQDAFDFFMDGGGEFEGNAYTFSNKVPLIVLTDGYTDQIDISRYFGKVLVLSTHSEMPLGPHNPALVKQIHIDIETAV